MSSSICFQSLIPDIKMNQDAVVELHPEELQLSADEDESDGGHDDHDKGLQIRRTVTQVRRHAIRPWIYYKNWVQM